MTSFLLFTAAIGWLAYLLGVSHGRMVDVEEDGGYDGERVFGFRGPGQQEE